MRRTGFLLMMSVAVMLFLSACSRQQTELIHSVSDLNKNSYTIGVPVGTPPEEVAKQYMPNAKISYITQIVNGISALKSGKVTAICYDSAGVDRILLNNPDLVKIPEELGKIEIAAVMRKKDTALARQINDFIQKLKQDGTSDEMYNRWIANPGGKMPDIPAPVNPEKPLKVITNGLTEPMNFYENGQLTGYDIEFIRRFAAYANIQCEFITMDYEAMISALQSGKGDIIVSDFFKTEERGEEILYSDPYVVLHNNVIVKKSIYDASGQTITSNEQLNGKRVGFITGMIHIENFRPHYKAEEYEFSGFSPMLEALKAGKVDALLSNDSVAKEIIKENPGLIMLPPYAEIYASVGVNKNNTELGDKLDAVIKRFLKDGTIDRIEKKWSGSDEEAKVLPTVNLTGENGTLIVGVLGDDYPSSYYKNNELVGQEVELAQLFASELGMKLKLVAMDFSGIIPGIASGKIDLAFGLGYSEERAKSIRFLSPMSTFSSVATVKSADYVGTASDDTFLSSLKDSFHKTFLVEDRYKMILQGLWVTIIISLLSVLLGSLLGVLVCAMRRSRTRFLSGLAQIYIRLIQGVPIVLLLMILYYILFAKVDIDPVLIAVVGFSLNFAAYASEIFRIAIDATDRGQLEAAYALGFSKYAGFFKVTLPQALRHILPIYKGEFVSMVKMTSVVGYIAIQDLTKMSDIIRSRTFDAFFPLFATAFIYFVLTYLFIFVMGKAEVRIDPKRRRRIVKGVRMSVPAEKEEPI